MKRHQRPTLKTATRLHSVDKLSLTENRPLQKIYPGHHQNFKWRIYERYYSGSTSNEDEDELPMKRRDLHQSQSNLHCTISFFSFCFYFIILVVKWRLEIGLSKILMKLLKIVWHCILLWSSATFQIVKDWV